jgi:putative ABC transport system ATP-binding protein
MSAALETQGLSKVFGSGTTAVTAVDSVSLAVEPGEFLALVGPSGSGKTTVLAMLAALLRPSGGSIMIDGQDLVSLSEPQRAAFRRRKIGFTFQANNLVPYLTALENVELLLRLNGDYDARGAHRARELLERLGLQDRMRALPRQLSGGEQQRVAIARSLINQPTVVLADEPTAALDTDRAFQVVRTLASLVHELGRAGIMVTHDLRMIEFADRVVQLVDGRIERSLSARDDIMCLSNPALCKPVPLDALGLQPQASGVPDAL